MDASSNPLPVAVPLPPVDSKPTEYGDFMCDRHGKYVASRFEYHGRFSPWSHCPLCNEEEQRREEDRRLRRIEQRIGATGAIGRYQNATLDNYVAASKEQRAALQACREFADSVVNRTNTGAGVILIGNVGTGKTHLLFGAARAVALADFMDDYGGGRTERRDGRALVITASALVRRLRATWRDGASETEDAVLKDLRDLDLLAIDEIGATFGSEAEQVQVGEIVDIRYRARRPTMVGSNLPLPQLKAALGDRAFDRLREGARVVPCTWPSHRGAA